MPGQLGLRLRIALFFALLAGAGTLAIWLSLFAAHARGMEGAQALVFAGLLSALLLLGLVTAIWMLFDTHVARPIEALSVQLRARAHAGVAAQIGAETARYLGDLAPAAKAACAGLGEAELAQARAVAERTEALSAQAARLTEVLSGIPVATVLLNSDGRIVLYDGQAAEVLAGIAPPRLGAPLSDYFDADEMGAALAQLAKTAREVAFEATGARGNERFDLTLRPLGDGAGSLLVIGAAQIRMAPEAARPLVYDFALMDVMDAAPGAQGQRPLDALALVVFDLETTGLLPHRDAVVQLGAVRVLNGQIVAAEAIETLVDPGRPIPAASTRVHGIDDAMTRGAPDMAGVMARFHPFCVDAVMVAHNAPFDMAFLHKALGPDAWPHPVLDTVLLSAVLYGTTEKHSLDALCERLGVRIPLRLRHTALGDAMATAEVLVRMIPMLMARGVRTLDDAIAQSQRHGRLLKDLN